MANKKHLNLFLNFNDDNNILKKQNYDNQMGEITKHNTCNYFFHV